jgi:hypothetical protein
VRVSHAYFSQPQARGQAIRGIVIRAAPVARQGLPFDWQNWIEIASSLCSSQ